jgi:threonine dehydrogenase-like Zn-dependent dehydrogenase
LGDVAMNFTEREPVQAIFDKIVGRGVDVALDALGTPETFGAACA